jgi:patatin-like phospholipase/acyl hydrolase
MFPPQRLLNKAGQKFTMIDGGVFAKHPAMCAIVEAHKIYDAENFLVVSIGAGSGNTPDIEIFGLIAALSLSAQLSGGLMVAGEGLATTMQPKLLN